MAGYRAFFRWFSFRNDVYERQLFGWPSNHQTRQNLVLPIVIR
jgi:hypothetical protein